MNEPEDDEAPPTAKANLTVSLAYGFLMVSAIGVNRWVIVPALSGWRASTTAATAQASASAHVAARTVAVRPDLPALDEATGRPVRGSIGEWPGRQVDRSEC